MRTALLQGGQNRAAVACYKRTFFSLARSSLFVHPRTAARDIALFHLTPVAEAGLSSLGSSLLGSTTSDRLVACY
jgi:hypothetical protein